MKKHNNVKNNVSNAYPHNTTTMITAKKHKEPHYNMQLIYYKKEEKDANRSQLINIEVFKPLSRNTSKWLKMREKTQKATRTKKMLRPL